MRPLPFSVPRVAMRSWKTSTPQGHGPGGRRNPLSVTTTLIGLILLVCLGSVIFTYIYIDVEEWPRPPMFSEDRRVDREIEWEEDERAPPPHEKQYACAVPSIANPFPTGQRKVVLVTGGAGFIGYHTVMRLREENAYVVVLDTLGMYRVGDRGAGIKRKRAQLLQQAGAKVIEGHLCDGNLVHGLFAESLFTHVIHLAGPEATWSDSFYGVSESIESLAECFVVLLQSVRKQEPPPAVIYGSSADVYGHPDSVADAVADRARMDEGARWEPWREGDRADGPLTPYAALVRGQEATAFVYQHLYDIPVTGLRIAHAFGTWDRPNGAVSRAVKRAVSGKDDPDILRTLEYVDVGDVAEAFIRATNMRYTCNIFNVGSGVTLTAEEVFDVVSASVSGGSLEAHVELAGARPSTPSTDRAIPLSLAHSEEGLGYVPSHKRSGADARAHVLEAMRRAVDWELAAMLEREKVVREVVLSSYFTSQRDPQRKSFVPPNRRSYMERWLNSIEALGKEAYVFHDGLGTDFMARYQGRRVTFVRCDLMGRSTNDARFYLYREWLLNNPDVRRVLVTDISDVWFQRDPFRFMEFIGDERVYVGSDVEVFPNMASMGWLKPRIKTCFGTDEYWADELTAILGLNTVYNAGLLGGATEVVVRVLDNIVEVLDRTPANVNCNMPVFNYVLHRFFQDIVYAGFPLNSRFMMSQSKPAGVYVVHK